ncbi:MAG: glycosyltransferase family 1 protein, partial [Caldilineaceae bacterium]|nr:glycosyltransferase family 1 protein [Caldilineaceae bacterium]
IPEVVDGAGILVDPLDELQIADAIGRVVSDLGERERLIRAGRGRAAEFPWDRTGEGLLAAYRSLAERS